MQSVKNIARGLVMGAADVVPGVSGGTMALILGIYERFIAALAALDLALARSVFRIGRQGGLAVFLAHAQRTDLWFLMQIGIGIGAALILGAHVIGSLIEGYPAAMMALFFGLILVSARIPWHRIEGHGWRQMAAAAVGFVVAAATAVMPSTDRVPGDWFLMIAGGLAITAMLLPGISGSALLVLLGVYPVVLSAVQDLDILALTLFGGGAILGLLLASRGIKWLLARVHDTTMAALAGLMVGSLARVWPWRDSPGFGEGMPEAPDTWVPVVFLVLGAALSLGMEALGVRRAVRTPESA